MSGTGRTAVVVILVLVVLPLLWGGMMMGGMGHGMMAGWGGSAGWDRWDPWRAVLGMVSTVLVITSIGAAAWWVFGRTTLASHPSGQSGARGILDARYARGEITRGQYRQMRGDLKSWTGPAAPLA